MSKNRRDAGLHGWDDSAGIRAGGPGFQQRPSSPAVSASEQGGAARPNPVSPKGAGGGRHQESGGERRLGSWVPGGAAEAPVL